MTRKIDEAWEALDEHYGIVEAVECNDFVKITADQMQEMRSIEEYSLIKFEPRLLTHFDNSEQQPVLFKENNLSILPTSRGEYVIGSFNPFMKIEKDPDKLETKKISTRNNLKSLEPNLLFNETMGLNYAEAHGILSDFFGEEATSTVAGRQRGGNWSYEIRSNGNLAELSVNNPQIEIDAGYEGGENLYLIEAKNKLVEEFCLRQLYFPYRAWSERVDKPVKTVFAAINNADIYLYEYAFENPDIFEGELIRALRYVIQNEEVTKKEVVKLLKETTVVPEPNVTFPQANSPLRTIDVIERIFDERAPDEDESFNSHYLADLYGFAQRQGLYYADSAAYFGYLEKNSRAAPYVPTKLAVEYNLLDSSKEKNLHICKSLFRRPVFRDVFETYLYSGSIMNSEEIGRIIQKYRNDISGSTLPRRGSTVRAWMKWIISLWE